MEDKKEIYDFVKRLMSNEKFKSEFLSASASTSDLSSITTFANSAYNSANVANLHANAAFNAANTVVSTNDLIVAGRNANNQINGFKDKDGNYISGLETYTWAQFTDATFDTANTRRVIVTDVSQDGEGHSLWEIVPTATLGNKRKLLSPPIYFSSLNTAPYASQWKGLRIRCGNFGLGDGAVLRSDGARWRPEESNVILLANTQNHVHNASFTSMETAYAALLPVDANNKCIMQPGDMFNINEFVINKTGTADVLQVSLYVGKRGNTSDDIVLTSSGTANTSVTIDMFNNKWIRRADISGNSSIEKITVDSLAGLSGSSTTAKSNPDTLTFNLDSANNNYISLGYKVQTSSTDTNLRAWYTEISFIKGF